MANAEGAGLGTKTSKKIEYLFDNWKMSRKAHHSARFDGDRPDKRLGPDPF